MTLWNDFVAYAPDLFSGLGVSLRLTAFSLGLGFPLGLLLALGMSSKKSVLRGTSIVLTEIGRGTPALVMLQIVYFGLPAGGLTLTGFVSAGIAFALTTGAYSSEIIRGGLQSVPQGEVEASEALGMSSVDTLRFILVPQGLRVAIPALMGFSILMFQATSLAYSIALPELLSRAFTIGSANFNYLSILTIAGLMYAAVTVPMSWLSGRAEKRLSRHV